MSETTFQAVKNNMQHKNYVPPVTEYRLGWIAYTNGLSEAECGTSDMRRGWRAALNAESVAVTSEYLEAVPA